MVEVGSFIHPDLFRAVSEVLQQVAWLDHLQGKDTLLNTTIKARQKAQAAQQQEARNIS